jgi:hypothetical protein
MQANGGRRRQRGNFLRSRPGFGGGTRENPRSVRVGRYHIGGYPLLSQKVESDTADKAFCVLDIENAKGGGLLAIGVSWREADRVQHKRFYDWGSWFEWHLHKSKTKRIGKTFRTVYAHNGGGWDWLSFLQWFIKNKTMDDVSIGLVSAQSKLVFLEIAFLRDTHDDEKGRKRLTIRLCDSMYLLRSGLNKLAKTFVGRGKTEADIEDVWDAWDNDRPRFNSYLESDCGLLLEVLERALDLIREKIVGIKRLGLTIGSTAMDIYRTIWNGRKNSIFTNLPNDKDDPDNNVEAFCRKGYHGGRVEVFRHGYFPDVEVWDINSLYPYAMNAVKVPTTARGNWTTRIYDTLPGCYEVTYVQRRRDIPPVLLNCKGNGEYSGTGYYYSPELHLLRRVDPSAIITVVRGFAFADADYIFREFVDRLYTLRQEYGGDSAIGLLSKFLLNSLYGKFGQRSERSKLVVFDSRSTALLAELELADEIATAIKNGTEIPTRKLEPLKRGEDLYYLESETKVVEHAHVGIAGVITSQARVELYNRILIAGGRNVAYSDTDSIHVIARKGCFKESTELGGLKREHVGEAVYVGKKLYSLRSADGKEKTRAKGISIGGKYGSDLRFDQLRKLVESGGKLACHFARPPTFRAVLSGQQSCVMNGSQRTRRIQKT